MKIAIITDDGKSISQHFGRAPYYLVVSIEEGKVTGRELREKVGHGQFTKVGEEEHGHEHHGNHEATHGKHAMMAQSIYDCSTMICGGMGIGAYESMRILNINPIVTNLRDVDEAINQYLEGNLVDHPEMLH